METKRRRCPFHQKEKRERRRRRCPEEVVWGCITRSSLTKKKNPKTKSAAWVHESFTSPTVRIPSKLLYLAEVFQSRPTKAESYTKTKIHLNLLQHNQHIKKSQNTLAKNMNAFLFSPPNSLSFPLSQKNYLYN